MSLQAHYDAMRQAALPRLARGAADLDALLDSAHDDRRGLTLLTRPPAPIIARLEPILADFRASEPAQYYYPTPDIHLTILSIIACYSGFTLDLIDPADYRRAVQAILRDSRPFVVTFAGLTASPGGIMVQGFPADDSLDNLREAVRKFFRHAGLPQSIDQRYRINTAHSTIVRFRSKILNPSLLVEKINRYQQQFIGSFEVNTAELVYNDWYQRADTTVQLGRYSLGRV